MDRALGEKVISMLGEGKQMARICYETKLSKAAILDWLESDPARAEAASRARARAAHALVDEALEIADDVDSDHQGELQKAKLRIQARHWAAERWNRPLYGAQNASANVTINLGDLHLQALRKAPTVRDVEDIEPNDAPQQ